MPLSRVLLVALLVALSALCAQTAPCSSPSPSPSPSPLSPEHFQHENPGVVRVRYEHLIEQKAEQYRQEYEVELSPESRRRLLRTGVYEGYRAFQVELGKEFVRLIFPEAVRRIVPAFEGLITPTPEILTLVVENPDNLEEKQIQEKVSSYIIHELWNILVGEDEF